MPLWKKISCFKELRLSDVIACEGGRTVWRTASGIQMGVVMVGVGGAVIRLTTGAQTGVGPQCDCEFDMQTPGSDLNHQNFSGECLLPLDF